MACARRLPFVAVFLLLVQYGHASSSSETCSGRGDSCKQSVVSDIAENMWHYMMDAVIASAKYMAEYQRNMSIILKESGRKGEVPYITDEDIEKVLDIISEVAPEETRRKGPGKGDNFVIHSLRATIDYVKDEWRKSEIIESTGRSLESEAKHLQALHGFFSSPVRFLFDLVSMTKAERSERYDVIMVDFVKFSVIPTIRLARTLMSVLMNIANATLDICNLYVGSARSAPNALSTTLDVMREVHSVLVKTKYSQKQFKHGTFYAERFDMLKRELVNRDAGLITQALNLLGFGLRSGLGFIMVYHELIKECYSDKYILKYTVIQGQSQVDEDHLHRVMDNANRGRYKVCQFYVYEMGPDAEFELEIVIKEFQKIQAVSYKETECAECEQSLLFLDTAWADAIAQNMFGDVEGACMLHFLCYSGKERMNLVRRGKMRLARQVDFLMGMVVSGKNNFSQLLDQSVFNKIGNTKMAEAIVQGYNNDCKAYESLTNCHHLDEFLKDPLSNEPL